MSEKKEETKSQIAEDWQNKTTRTILIGGVVVLLVFVFSVIFINSLRTFEYSGMKFEKKVAGNVVFYETDFPIFKDDKNLTYQLFIRTDPRKLGEVGFNGTINAKQVMVLNSTNELNCNGDGVISMANMYQLFPYIGINLINDPNASCDENDRYMLVNIAPSSTETKIIQTGKSCYQIEVANCEILKGTERFMIEVLLKRKDTLDL